MPTPKELLDAGDLNAAIEALTQEVREAPTDPQKRTFLFELLAFAGDWDRAEKQVAAVAGADAPSQMGNRGLPWPPPGRTGPGPGLRRKGAAPLPPGGSLVRREEPRRNWPDQRGELRRRPVPSWTRPRKNALPFPASAARKLSATCATSTTSWPAWSRWSSRGSTPGFPLEQAKSLEPNPPKKLRDLIWPGAHITADDGTSGDVFLFALYPGSSAHADNLVKLGRMTDWKSLSDDLQVGLGLRSFLVDDTDVSLFELGPVDFDAHEDLPS